VSRNVGSITRKRAVTDARQRAWNAMRILKTFTLADVGPVADIGERNLRTYLNALYRSGYLAVERPKRNGHVNGHVVWRLTRNSGAKRPHPLRDGSGLYDPNRDQVYPYREEAPDGTLAENVA